MKTLKLAIILFLINFSLVYAQVGIGTTTPNSRLDIRSSNQATPANNDGILIPKIDEFPTINPTAAHDGMMVFVTGAGTPSKGFYYWDNGLSSWVNFTTGGNDHDWYEQGGTTAPDNINDDKYTFGRTSIGTNNVIFPLHVHTSSAIRSLNVTNTATSGIISGIHNELSGNVTNVLDSQRGLYNFLPGSSDNNQFGVYNNMTGTGNGMKYGVYNAITQNSSSDLYGTYNTITGSASGGTYSRYGTYNRINNSSVSNNYGVFNYLIGGAISPQTGIQNVIANSTSATQYGVRNILGSTGSTGQQYGVYNEFTSTSNAAQTGISNNLSNNGSGIKFGVINNLSGDGDDLHYGTINNITGDGDGQKIGTNNFILSTGIGDKFTSFNRISSSSGGTGYGVYSDVIKAGSFSGFFRGFVAIGTEVFNSGVPNYYIFPASRGTANQVMRTDGAGNVTWVDGTTLGDDDHDFYEEGTTIAPNDINDNMFTMGNVAIGKSTTTWPFDLESSVGGRGASILMNGSANVTTYGLLSEITNSSDASHVGLFGRVLGGGDGEHRGVHTLLNGGGTGLHYGMLNEIQGAGTGYQYGVRNNISNSSDSWHFGMYNELTGTGTGQHSGVVSVFREGTGNLTGAWTQFSDNVGNGNQIGRYTTFLTGTTTGLVAGGFTDIATVVGDGVHYSTYSRNLSDGDGDHFGMYNILSGSGDGDHWGAENILSGSGTGFHSGTRNIFSEGSGNLTGTWNQFSGNVGNGNQIGMFNNYFAGGNGVLAGVYTQIQNTVTGTGIHYGVYTDLSSQSAGTHYGMLNLIALGGGAERLGIRNTFTGDNGADTYGVSNAITGTNTGNNYGIHNLFSGSSDGANYGLWNLINPTNNNVDNIGVRNEISNGGTMNVYGTYNLIGGAGAGDKYGTFIQIGSGSGGTHYGVYSDVLKVGSFAGYFLGDVSIGTTAANSYIMPLSRGINGQVITTDGVGNLSWANASTFADNLGNHNATTTLDLNTNQITEVSRLITTPTDDYDKIRVYNSANYTIGMHSAMTYGFLNDWATTFTMNNDLDRGWVWRDVSDAQNDGAMSLTTDGRMTLKTYLNIPNTVDASGTVNTGALQIGNNLRIDLNEIITNTNNTLWVQYDNNGDFRVDNTTLCVDASLNRVGIGTIAPAYQLQLTANSAAKPTSNAWTVASDAQLKTNVRPFTDGINLIKQINPVWFTYNGKAGMPIETGVGTLAQEFQKIAPYMVKPWDYTNEDGSTESYLGVDYGPLNFVVVNAIQEQQSIIENQQSEIDLLKQQIEEIKLLLIKE